MSVPAAYLAVILIWSTTPLAIKWSALGSSYAFAVMARMLIGLLLAIALIVIGRIGMPMHTTARRSYMVGGFGLFGAMTCTYWSAQYIDSGLVAVFFGLSPLITSVLAAVWLDASPLRPVRVVGMLLGLIGLAVIFMFGTQIKGDEALAGMVVMLLAVVIYCASLVWMKRIGDDSPPLATTAGTLIVSLPLFTLAWILADGHVPSAVPTRASAAIIYLGVFGSVMGFAFYYYVIRHMEAGKIALISMVTPALALLMGHALNGEVVSARVWLGVTLISAGLFLHHWETPASVRLRERGAL